MRMGAHDLKALARPRSSLVLWAIRFSRHPGGLAAYPPAYLVLLRFLIASASLVVWAVDHADAHARLRTCRAWFCWACLDSPVSDCAHFGQADHTAGAAYLIVDAVPFSWPCWHILLGESSRFSAAGTLVSFAGIALVSSAKAAPPLEQRRHAGLAGDARHQPVLVLQRPYLKRYSPFQMTAIGIWAGTALMAASGCRAWPMLVVRGAARAHPCIVYLGVLPGALAYAAWPMR